MVLIRKKKRKLETFTSALDGRTVLVIGQLRGYDLYIVSFDGGKTESLDGFTFSKHLPSTPEQ